MSTARVVLRLTDVVKTFPGVVALKGVSFEVAEGEVHALVGENGAGKSTLMSVAAGSTLPDEGTVEIGGRVLEQPSPAAAQELGLAVVYQHLSILEDLTVAENMVFAMPPRLRPSMARAAAWTREKVAAIGASIDPAARVNELSIADRQLLEIAKALALESKVLVLDEPTESLTPAESDRLFEQVRAITQTGTAVVYISHRLPEVLGIADRITVLRDGAVRGTMPASEASEDEILRLIIGRSVEHAFPDKDTVNTDAEVLLDVASLSGPRFRDVTVGVRRGEIVGLAGVEGNGQREFLRALAGLLPARGEVRLAGEHVSLGDPGRVLRAGIVHLPGDRHVEGLLLPLSVRENVSLLALPKAARAGFVDRRREQRIVAEQVGRLAVKTPSLETPVASLSGGNQQKVLFARSLLAEPAVLLADEPTRGVDAGARMEIYQVLRGSAEAGKAVVVLSSDVVELQGLCDRVLVFSRGQIVRELEGAEITEENITGAAITSQTRLDALAARARRMLRVRRFATGDYLPMIVLAALVAGLGAYTASRNDFFLTKFNLIGMLLLASALALIALGQLIVLLTGGIDLSVGPLTALVVVVLSFFSTQSDSHGRLVLGILAVVGVALVVGLTNGILVRVFKLAPVLATLATYIVIQGVALLLRPQPAGYVRPGVTAALKTSIGPIPAAFIGAAVLAIVCELVLRYTRLGLALRAVGSDETRAHRLGARVNTTHIAAYVLCSLFTAAGGIMLASQVAIGDARVGLNYTLTSITAVVLGGASIFGGRGSFIGAFFGALLIQEIVTSTTFLQIGTQWQYYLPGILILVGAGIYSRARRLRAVAPGVGAAA
ncbi:MAG: ribose transport system permease protein rbsA [Gaiellaceae bacterium]|jgi:ribose transport system ATP-binding protein|nr:ribose transport system permease protein rbsA [Gaiellaceae bacterium]